MLTDALEKALNRNLARSPRARELLESLAGRRLEIELRGTRAQVSIESSGTALRVGMSSFLAPPAGTPARAPPDARVSGSLLALLSLAGSDPEAVIRRGDAEITGDAEIAARFRELARLLRPDLEEELSRWVGDAPAHQAARLAKSALGFGRRAITTGARNLAEYLSHETQDLVCAAEAESLFRDVEQLREDVDRLEARIALLASPASPAPVRSAEGGGPAEHA
jgi:ubiquinone biosynthesis protein UbiJ